MKNISTNAVIARSACATWRSSRATNRLPRSLPSLAMTVVVWLFALPVFAAEPSLETAKQLIESEVMISSPEIPYEDLGVITTNKGLTLQTRVLNPSLTEQTHKGQVGSKCFMISGPASRIWIAMPKDKEIRIDVIGTDGQVAYSDVCARREPPGLFDDDKFKIPKKPCSSCDKAKP